MAKKPENNKKKWSAADLNKLRKMAKQNKPTTDIAIELKRTEASVRSKSSSEGISLGGPN